jgi:enoyl-CoA hydratase/carnithine racemase
MELDWFGHAAFFPAGPSKSTAWRCAIVRIAPMLIPTQGEKSMTGFTQITTDVTDGIFTLTLHRPEKMNAFTETMMKEMIAAFDMADADDAVRAIIVTGAGERAFCAGADLSSGGATFDYASRPDRSNSQSAVRADGTIDVTHEGARDGGGRVTLRIFNCKKPVIGAINGAAVGIGVTMQLPMDFRMASTTARFGFVFARRGIVPEAASSWFLPRLVGISQALDWCYSGRVFGAEEALKGGLVRSIHAPEDLMAAARAFAHELTAESAPVSIALTRQMMWRMLGASHPMEAHKLDSRAIWARGAAGDAKEGVSSFLEKRTPTYPDKVSTDTPHIAPWMDEPSYG